MLNGCEVSVGGRPGRVVSIDCGLGDGGDGSIGSDGGDDEPIDGFAVGLGGNVETAALLQLSVSQQPNAHVLQPKKQVIN